MRFVEVSISASTLEKCRLYTDLNFPKHKDPHPNNIFDAPDKDLIGLLGECGVTSYYGGDIDYYLNVRPVGKSDNGFDVVVNHRRYDIKTLSIVHKPKDNYDTMLPEIQANNRNAEGFIFGHVLKDYTLLWITGWLEKAQVFNVGELHYDGDPIPPHLIRKFTCNTYLIPLRHLNSIPFLHHGRCPKCDDLIQKQRLDGDWVCYCCGVRRTP